MPFVSHPRIASPPRLLQSSGLPNFFHIETISGSARLGRLNTPHGVIETPVFMPVGTLASVKGSRKTFWKNLKCRFFLATPTTLYFPRPGVEQVRQLEWAASIYGLAARDSH